MRDLPHIRRRDLESVEWTDPAKILERWETTADALYEYSDHRVSRNEFRKRYLNQKIRSL